MLRPILQLINRLAMPGAILRELGHYLLAAALRAKVTAVKWFDWKSMVSDDGYIMPDGGRVLGYARFGIDSRCRFPVLKLFLVGAGPMLTCGAVWFLAATAQLDKRRLSSENQGGLTTWARLQRYYPLWEI